MSFQELGPWLWPNNFKTVVWWSKNWTGIFKATPCVCHQDVTVEKPLTSCLLWRKETTLDSSSTLTSISSKGSLKLTEKPLKQLLKDTKTNWTTKSSGSISLLCRLIKTYLPLSQAHKLLCHLSQSSKRTKIRRWLTQTHISFQLTPSVRPTRAWWPQLATWNCQPMARKVNKVQVQ